LFAPPARRRRALARKGAAALGAWGLTGAKIRHNLGGSANASWLVRSSGGEVVLRGVEGDRDYLDYQVTVLSHLRASSFAVPVPELLPTLDGSYVHVSDEIAWILYPYLPGTPPEPVETAADASRLGALIGSFGAAVADLDLGLKTGCFALPLFQREAVTAALSSSSASLDPGGRQLLTGILRAYEAIPDSIIDAVAGLPRQTVYNDWHRWNLLQTGGEFSGLIDFDSLVEAPRVVDFQNGLSHLLMDRDAPEAELIDAYLRGYAASTPLPPNELALVWPLMLDRLLSLTADLASQGRPNTPQAEIAARAVRLADWLAKSEPAELRPAP